MYKRNAARMGKKVCIKARKTLPCRPKTQVINLKERVKRLSEEIKEIEKKISILDAKAPSMVHKDYAGRVLIVKLRKKSNELIKLKTKIGFVVAQIRMKKK